MHLLFRIIVLLLFAFLPDGRACSYSELHEQKTTQETVHERFKLPKDSKILLLPVEIQGKKYSFVLDTAATVTCYDISLRSLLGDSIRSATMHTPDGVKAVLLYRPPAAKLGRINMPTKSPVGCVDFRKWREVLKEEIYGTLGMDFLREHAFRIDFGRAEVTFIRSVGSDSGVHIPITFEHNIPQVEISFPGLNEREKFLVDTGYVGTDGCLRDDLFDVLSKQGLLTLVGDSKLETALGSGRSKQGLVEAISLGNIRHKKLLFAKSRLNALSLYYWSEYSVITFDFSNKAIYLKEKIHLDRPDGQKN